MKKIFLIGCIVWLAATTSLQAGVTTYTFTSTTWASTIGAVPCDRVTDGWICDNEGYQYYGGYTAADGRPWSHGVSVTTTKSGAGATSVQTFEDVRRVTINFCQNSSKGKGTIYVQVGDNEPESITIVRPAHSGEGAWNRDTTILFPTPQTGHVKFWVTCTENAILINTLSIRSASGGSSTFTVDTYQLVTDVSQLQDSDQVIFGVYNASANYIMGYFDEYESSNNIHAIRGRYSADRTQVAPDESAIYTLRITTLNDETAYIFQDELRYEEAYLVASGGQTKNRLAVWNHVTDPNSYGNYGYWSIAIEEGGEAVITNLGNSRSKIIQYNASNSPSLFACYPDRSQTPVCLYRRVPAMGEVAAIVAPIVNFGTTIETEDSRTIEVNAHLLTADISASLQIGEVFSLSATTLDRDGDNLTISYNTSLLGHYRDTLLLTSGETQTLVPVLLNLQQPLTIAQAVLSEDYEMVWLNEVVVTKKYDNYIYIRDETGSMLLFDRGDGETGKRYGANLQVGDRLTGVTGRFLNYFGVPEISPTEQFAVGTRVAVEPELAPALIDSADVCRYLALNGAVVNSVTELTYQGQTYPIINKFNIPSYTMGIPTRVIAIVSYDHDVVTLYIVRQEDYQPTGEWKVESLKCKEAPRKILREGQIYWMSEGKIYDLRGTQL